MQALLNVLEKHQIDFRFLDHTRDIWARDYMPIQVSKDRYIAYRYDPDYLSTKANRKYTTYTDVVCDAIGLDTIKTDIILDGGNIIKSHNTVLMTDKVFEENAPHYTKESLTQALQELFQTECIGFIPWDKEDRFGHADGMMRFIDDHNIMIQDYYKEYVADFQEKLNATLDALNIKRHTIGYDVPAPDEKLNWAYVNFLQLKDLIVVPQFGIAEDAQALARIQELYQAHYAPEQIVGVPAKAFTKGGGAFNCISWTVLM